jgi:DNA modification methylase
VIYEGDARHHLGSLPDNSIDMILTSPPYNDIYSYEGNHNYDFWTIANELYRVLKPGRVCVWIEGMQTKEFDETDNVYDHIIQFRTIGFKRLDTMIYQKKGFGKPEPTIRKRYVQAFEFMLILTKGKITKWNPLKDRKNTCAGMKHRGRTVRQKDGTLKNNKLETLHYNEYGLRYNIWQYQNSFGHGTKDKIAYGHPAIFPEKMAEDHIRTWSDPGEIILDPFLGSGTTAKMALLNNRKFIGIEKEKKYVDIANSRIRELFA